MYASARLGGDTLNLYAWDLATNRIDATPVMALDGDDFSGNLLVGKGKLLGLRYLAERRGTLCADEQAKAGALPGARRLDDPGLADTAQLKATSPVAQAARIMKRNNPQMEWVVYEEEGHGWSLPKNRIDFWSRAERFLDRHIGKHGAAAKKE